jgi:hypothetical protein
MTIKAIDMHGRVRMAGVTKMLFTANSRIASIFLRQDMAINAFFEAMFLRPNTSTHSVITLMQHKVHMITPHIICGLHALLPFSSRNIREWYGR